MLYIQGISYSKHVVIHFKRPRVRKWAWFNSLFFEDLYWSVFGISLLLKVAVKNHNDGFKNKLFSFEYSWLGINVWNNDFICVFLPNLYISDGSFFRPKLLTIYLWFVNIRVSSIFRIETGPICAFDLKPYPRFMLYIQGISYSKHVVIHFKRPRVRKWAWFNSLFFEDLYWSVFGISLLLKVAVKNHNDGFKNKLFSFEYSWLGINVWNNDFICVFLPNLYISDDLLLLHRLLVII